MNEIVDSVFGRDEHDLESSVEIIEDSIALVDMVNKEIATVIGTTLDPNN